MNRSNHDSGFFAIAFILVIAAFVAAGLAYFFGGRTAAYIAAAVFTVTVIVTINFAIGEWKYHKALEAKPESEDNIARRRMQEETDYPGLAERLRQRKEMMREDRLNGFTQEDINRAIEPGLAQIRAKYHPS